jgi:hypothetical protein
MTSTTSGWNALAKRLDGIDKPTRTLKLCDDPAVHDRYLAAKQAAERAQDYAASLPKDADKDARALVDKQHREAKAALETAQQEYDAHTVTLTFRALERGELEKLQAAHPATEEDEALGRDFNFDTFAPELISAASVDGMPVEYAAQAMKTWSLADSEDLWNAAWSVQRRKRTDLGKG